VSAPEPFDLNDYLGAGLDSAATVALDAHLYASYCHDLLNELDALKAERDALRDALEGMLVFEPDHKVKP
jgi:hypothetical protein